MAKLYRQNVPKRIYTIYIYISVDMMAKVEEVALRLMLRHGVCWVMKTVKYAARKGRRGGGGAVNSHRPPKPHIPIVVGTIGRKVGGSTRLYAVAYLGNRIGYGAAVVIFMFTAKRLAQISRLYIHTYIYICRLVCVLRQMARPRRSIACMMMVTSDTNKALAAAP